MTADNLKFLRFHIKLLCWQNSQNFTSTNSKNELYHSKACLRSHSRLDIVFIWVVKVQPDYAMRNSLQGTTCDQTMRLINSSRVFKILQNSRFFWLLAMYFNTSLYHADSAVPGSEIYIYKRKLHFTHSLQILINNS